MNARLSRRILLLSGACAAVGGGSAKAADDPRMAPFDREMEQFMRARNVPGGALAVVKDRRLVYARGYGLADREKGEPVRAGSVFRIASVSKTITAVAVMKLVEEGKLDLDARA